MRVVVLMTGLLAGTLNRLVYGTTLRIGIIRDRDGLVRFVILFHYTSRKEGIRKEDAEVF
jgi:hypothetical protein